MAPDPGAEPGTDAASGKDTAQAHGADEPAEAAPDEGAPRKRKRSFWRDLLIIVLAALVLTVVLKAYVVQVFSIPSGSMENTLLPGDRILVNKLVYRFRSIEPGDIVVFSGAGSWDPPNPPPANWFARVWGDVTGLVGISAPGTDYIKRVIGVPGDRVACCDSQGRVTVNGVALNEKAYIYPGALPSARPFHITVPPGRLWVMGDNRSDSDDSRFQTLYGGDGTIPESAVVGRAFVIIWPFSRINDLPIPNTFEQAGIQAAAAVSAAPPAAVGGGSAVLAGAALAVRRRGAGRPED
jgi:signal peptidase I